MKKRFFEIGYIAVCLFVSSVFLLSSFSNYTAPCKDEAPLTAQYTFAFTLQPGPNSGLITYWMVTVHNDKIVYKTPMTEKNFILSMKGEMYSKANPTGINLFEQAVQSDSCFYQYYWEKEECNPLDYYRLDDLWTLRYNRNPECPEGCTPAKGMRVDGLAANKTYPSDAQMAILQDYGVSHYTGFFYGDDMFRIFTDINDPNWVNNYENAQ
ncbi:hypothetical protein [Parvicella tangerina]|uniref:Uncharacterized protein n=1 Tax=Parvicella tangerina TaxID=2829795 RepID=A0A916NS36_9FLAO|nr:hypothetical protein [Parvicella tangerina]CAG5082919.1 hypothetical protein CRYO30217_02043 [Parvicella tangerina]